MSRTDKTDPYWIRLLNPPKGVIVEAVHRCGNGVECDLGVYLPAPRHGPRRGVVLPRCSLWTKRYYNSKIYGRHPCREVRKAMGYEGGIRGELRRLRRDWKYEDREDIDSSWGAPRRRCQVRDPWNWD